MSDDPRTRDELLAAMRQGACPLCVLVERIERRAVDHFLYDQVNDIGRRDALRASRGLCLEHTAMLAEGRSALGVAILSRDILRAMTGELEAAGRGEAGLGWLRGRLGGAGVGAQLAARQAAIWRRVEAALDEFIRKHDHRFQGEVFEEERDVWRRALRATSGWYEPKDER